MSSFDEGYKFGLGILLATAEFDVIDAAVEVALGRKQDWEYDKISLNKKEEILKRMQDHVKQKTKSK